MAPGAPVADVEMPSARRFAVAAIADILIKWDHDADVLPDHDVAISAGGLRAAPHLSPYLAIEGATT